MHEFLGNYAINESSGLVINAYREKSSEGSEFFYPALLIPGVSARVAIGRLISNPEVLAIAENHTTKKLRFSSLAAMHKYIKDNLGDFEFSAPEDILG